MTSDIDFLATFLRAIHPTDVGWCELRALPSRDRIFVPVGDVAAVADFCTIHLDENVYVGVATRRTRDNGTAENCGELWCAFIDIDFKGVDETTARRRLAEFPLRPHVAVTSGNGVHVYWRLKEPFVFPDDKPAALSLLKRLALHFGGDLSVVDVARILRVPGTFNFKYDTPQPVAEAAWLM
jgi:hypothetical protein